MYKVFNLQKIGDIINSVLIVDEVDLVLINRKMETKF